MSAPARWVVGVDTPFGTLADVEHHLLDLGRRVGELDDTTLCTHEVRDERPHYALSVAFEDRPEPAVVAALIDEFGPTRVAVVQNGVDSNLDPSPPGAGHAIRQALARDGGRAVRFPGWRDVTGTLPIREVLAVSAITQIEVIGAAAGCPEVVIDTRDFVRPRWQDGELVLHVLPAGDGALAPFEVPNPTPCCAGHS
jgi:hypothetical protein